MLRLRELRGVKTQDYIAKAVNLRRETYRGYETGIRQADYETLIKLADYYNISIDYLLGRDFNPNSNQFEQAVVMSNKEKELLQLFNSCSLGLQNRVLGYIESGLEKERNIVTMDEQFNKRA